MAILVVGFPLHKPYPYSLYRWGFLHLRYLKCLVTLIPILASKLCIFRHGPSWESTLIQWITNHCVSCMPKIPCHQWHSLGEASRKESTCLLKNFSSMIFQWFPETNIFWKQFPQMIFPNDGWTRTFDPSWIYPPPRMPVTIVGWGVDPRYMLLRID